MVLRMSIKPFLCYSSVFWSDATIDSELYLSQEAFSSTKRNMHAQLVAYTCLYHMLAQLGRKSITYRPIHPVW